MDEKVPKWTLADRIRKAMSEAGVGVQELADELGVTRGAVSKWITNGPSHVEPKRPTLIAIALRTGVVLEWLESGEAAVGETAEPDAGEDAAGRGQATEPVTRPTEIKEPATLPPVASAFGHWARRRA